MIAEKKRPQPAKQMNMLPKITLIAAMGALASTAFSQTSIAPFTGDYSETFEGFPPQNIQLFLPNPTPAFAGFGTITTILGPGGCCGLAVYDPPANPFGNITSADGVKFAVTQDFGDLLSISFSSAIQNFGGYWVGSPLHVNFLDTNNVSVGSGDYDPQSLPDGIPHWLGWHLATPFKTVTVTSNLSNDTFALDSLQASVPEPGSLTLLALGGAFIAGRRRLAV